MSYWADQFVDGLPSAPAFILATGISPSGEIHIGNLREVMTAEGVFRVLRERDIAAEHIFIADNLDPLRRVYPFLDAHRYADEVGRSLSHIPCPSDCHESYSEHFLEPFLAGLGQLGITVRVERAHEMYASGRMNRVIGQALQGAARIGTILTELTGKEMKKEWSPFDPRCNGCARLTGATVTGFDLAGETVSYTCDCGDSGEVPFAGGGKLTWRVDWPARWRVLGVQIEPFGKDHASRGGSYDTGVRIVREVFEAEPPQPVPYEWIALKGQGDMSSSKGNVLSIGAMLQVVPPEVLRYLVLRTEPRKAIRFDPGLPLLNLMDELEDPEHKNRNARAAELAMPEHSGERPVPFRHLVTVGQVADFDLEQCVAILARTGYRTGDGDALARRLEHVRRWLQEFAPPEVRFAVSPELPPEAADLDREQRAFLADLAGRLPDDGNAEDLHALVYSLVEERGAPSPAPFFKAIYLALIGKERGPRAGHFLATLSPELVRDRLRAASR